MNQHFSLNSMKNRTVRITPIPLPEEDKDIKYLRFKGMPNGTLWTNDHSKVSILQVDETGTNSVKTGSVTVTNDDGEACKITSVAGTSVSPVVACFSYVNPTHKPKLLQVTYDGEKDCVVAEGNFHHMTVNINKPDTIYCLLCVNCVNAYRYEKGNNGNKWIHMRTYVLDTPEYEGERPEYNRIQVRPTTMLVASEWVMDEIDLGTGHFLKRIDNRPAMKGLFLGCVDKEGNILVVDLNNHPLYILDTNNEWHGIKTDRALNKPYDATLCNGKVFVLTREKEGENPHTNLFMLD